MLDALERSADYCTKSMSIVMVIVPIMVWSLHVKMPNAILVLLLLRIKPFYASWPAVASRKL